MKLTKQQIIAIAEPFHTISKGDYSFNLSGFADALLERLSEDISAVDYEILEARAWDEAVWSK